MAIRTPLLLLLAMMAALAAGACKGDQTTGYKGELPPLVDVTYRDLDGNRVTAQALEGWVSIVWYGPEKTSVVAETARPFDGEVVDAVPEAGIYTVAVPPSALAAFIDELNEDMRVVEAIPAVVLSEADVSAIDLPFDSALAGTGNACLDFHGNLTSSQIAQTGSNVTLISARPSNNWRNAVDLKARYPWMTYTGALAYEELKKGRVVNLSLQADTRLKDTAYRHAEVVFLASVFAVAESAPDGLVVVSAGNGGADGQGDDLTKYLESLRKQYPKAAKRVVVVEARDGGGRRAGFSNFATDGTTVSAPGVDIPVQTEVTSATGARVPVNIKCSGTSFSAPVVAAILDAMKQGAPGASAADITDTFFGVTGGVVPNDWDQGPFIARLVEALKSRPGPTATPTRPGPSATPTRPADNGGKNPSVTVTSVSCRFDNSDPFAPVYIATAEGTARGPVGTILGPDFIGEAFFGVLDFQAAWTSPGSRYYDRSRGPRDPETTTWRLTGDFGSPGTYEVEGYIFLPDNKGPVRVRKAFSCSE